MPQIGFLLQLYDSPNVRKCERIFVHVRIEVHSSVFQHGQLRCSLRYLVVGKLLRYVGTYVRNVNLELGAKERLFFKNIV